jgi:hypothetical protein
MIFIYSSAFNIIYEMFPKRNGNVSLSFHASFGEKMYETFPKLPGNFDPIII